MRPVFEYTESLLYIKYLLIVREDQSVEKDILPYLPNNVLVIGNDKAYTDKAFVDLSLLIPNEEIKDKIEKDILGNFEIDQIDQIPTIYKKMNFYYYTLKHNIQCLLDIR